MANPNLFSQSHNQNVDFVYRNLILDTSLFFTHDNLKSNTYEHFAQLYTKKCTTVYFTPNSETLSIDFHFSPKLIYRKWWI